MFQIAATPAKNLPPTQDRRAWKTEEVTIHGGEEFRGRFRDAASREPTHKEQ